MPRSAAPKKRVLRSARGTQPKPRSKPLSERDRIFIEHFLYHHELVPLLQMKPGPYSTFHKWTMKECRALLASKRIQRELTRRREEQELANAQQAARSRALEDRSHCLTPAYVKGRLVETIEDGWGPGHIRALGFALAVTGVLAKGELLTPPAALNGGGPIIYRALQSTVVQRVTETITHTQETPPELPLTIDAASLPPAEAPANQLDIEILDY